MKKKTFSFEIFKYLLLAAGVILIIFPIYLTIVTAFKTPDQSASNFFNLPQNLYLDNFKDVIQKANYFKYILNTTIIMVSTIIIEMIIIPAASYSISRNKHKKYYSFLFIFIMMGIFIPFQAKMIALVKMMSAMNLMSKSGIIILYVAATTPPAVFLFTGYLKSISVTLEESARIDGASTIKTYVKIIYPLMSPMLVTVLIKDSLFIWNDFLLPLIILNRRSSDWTLQMFQYNFKSQYSFEYNKAFASFLLGMLPISILYVFIQKYIIAGITEGSIKG